MDALRWAWVVIAMFFLITEIFTAGFVLACFGIGAAAAAILAFVGASPPWQFGAFAVVSAIAVALSRRFADRVTADRGAGIRVAGDRMLGKRAIVLEEIDPAEARGLVRVDDEQWRARSIDGSRIDRGLTVEVLGVDGTHLQVRIARAPGEAGAD